MTAAYFDALKDSILAAFRSAGGDFNAGRRTFGMRGRGLADVRLRATVVGLHGAHPYMRVLIQLALTADDLDVAITAWERQIEQPETTFTSFVVTQVNVRRRR